MFLEDKMLSLRHMELSIETKKYFRSLLFKHQDGIVIVAIIGALQEQNFFQFLESRSEVSLEDILTEFPYYHKGYLNVAMRALASQGLINYTTKEGRVSLSVNTKYDQFKNYVDLYKTFSSVYRAHLSLLHTPLMEKINITDDHLALASHFAVLKQSEPDNDYYQEEVMTHLEAVLLLPVLVYLNYRSNTLDKSVMEWVFAHDRVVQLFERLDLLEPTGGFTQKGQFLMAKSYAYGVTVSYWPIFTNIKAFLYGNFSPFLEKDEDGKEQHVLRAINVWGSGGAHSTYFKKFDSIIIDIFNRPLEQQPKGVIDVGCGNGALLEHVFDLIWNQTKRRRDLSENKLILIGADYNKEALLSTQRNLTRANIWAEVVWGDIGNPEALNEKLQKLYDVSLEDLLNVRSFLDHNRQFNFPKKEVVNDAISTGAFAHRGEFLANAVVEQSLVEHFEKWKPYIDKHGLLMIELHTVSPDKVAMNLGRTPCTAYDVTHGFSDQYILEIDAFKKAVNKAGLRIDEQHSFVFPNEETPTVSINLIQ